LRRLDTNTRELAGIDVAEKREPVFASGIDAPSPATEASGKLTMPLEIDAGIRAAGCEVVLNASVEGKRVPFLTRKQVNKGTILVLNVRTFSESDFGGGEWLLAPKELGLPKIPQPVADTIRDSVLKPLRVDVRASAGVQLLLFEKERCFYNFQPE